jgi:FkbM family methyltransferase
VDLGYLAENARTAWSARASVPDFVRRMAWVYSGHVPSPLTPRDWIISFRFPLPVGCVRLCLRSNNGADAFIHSEVFEHEHYRLPLERTPQTILDLGANIGLSSVYFARLFPAAQLACVEPAPDNVRMLARNLALNDVRASVIEAAVDVNDGQVLLELGDRDYAHQVVLPSMNAARPRLEVEAISVPTILRRLSWDRIGLLKVDIEGHEAVLFARDCDWLARVDAMCIEHHHHGADVELARLANAFGFLAPRLLPNRIWFLARQ